MNNDGFLRLVDFLNWLQNKENRDNKNKELFNMLNAHYHSYVGKNPHVIKQIIHLS